MQVRELAFKETVIGLVAVVLFVSPAAAEIRGEPTIIDGDSLEVEGYRFNLFGIDSPEPGTICWKENGDSFDCGRIATTALLDLTAGLEVVCTPLDQANPDETGIVPATCTAGGFSLNRNMVHTGWAIADRAATDAYVSTETEAKTAKRGLWRWSWKVQPPWPSMP
ncbi:MAG: thermonuclease family protein [Geminicoccaceae bacterium]